MLGRPAHVKALDHISCYLALTGTRDLCFIVGNEMSVLIVSFWWGFVFMLPVTLAASHKTVSYVFVELLEFAFLHLVRFWYSSACLIICSGSGLCLLM